MFGLITNDTFRNYAAKGKKSKGKKNPKYYVS